MGRYEKNFLSRKAWITAVSAISALSMCLMAIIANPEQASAAASDAISAPSSQEVGASGDARAIKQAATQQDSQDPSSTVSLIDAASAQNAIPLQKSDQEQDDSTQAGTSTGAGSVAVSDEGTVTATGPDGMSVSINPAGPDDAVQIVDGSLVDNEAAPATSIVTSAIDQGIRTAAVLADSSAPNAIAFSYNLPENASLEAQTDGSILVKAPVTQDVASQTEIDRYDDAVKATIGNVTDSSQLSDAQIEQLAAIPPERTTSVTSMQTVATIAAPWATDANGKQVATYYQINGTGITQVIETNASTTYPVTADPSWVWWAGTSASCAAGVVSFAVAVAKIPAAAAKLTKLINAAKSSKRLAKAVKTLGGAKQAVTDIINVLRGSKLSKNQAAALRILENTVGKTILAALGVDGCWALFKRLV